MGYIGKTGRVVVEPQFAIAEPFENSLARVSVGKSFGYIDTAGRVIWDPRWALSGIVDITGQEAAQRSVDPLKQGNRVLPPPAPRAVKPPPYPPAFRYQPVIEPIENEKI